MKNNKYRHIIFFFLFCSCSAQKYAVKITEDKIITLKFVNSDFDVYPSKENIPENLTAFLEKNIRDFCLAGINEPFNMFDFTQNGVSNKRLIYWGENKLQNMNFILYEQGGTTVSNVLVVSMRKEDNIEGVQIYSFNNRYRDLFEIKNLLENKDYIFINSYRSL